MSYQVLQNTWIGVTSEPLYQRENYDKSDDDELQYAGCTGWKCTKSCSDIKAKNNDCSKYIEYAEEKGVPKVVQCENRGGKHCKIAADKKYCDPLDIRGYNNVGFDGNEFVATGIGILGQPCCPSKFFKAAPGNCDDYSSKNLDNKYKSPRDCYSRYKTSPNGEKFYCGTKNLKNYGGINPEWDCKPTHKQVATPCQEIGCPPTPGPTPNCT
jgi:hypothetical protein